MPSTFRKFQLHRFDRQTTLRAWHCSWCGLDVPEELMRAISLDPLEVSEFMTTEEIETHRRRHAVADAMTRLDIG